MLVKCEYCGNYYEDFLENCEHCGAINKYVVKLNKEIPKTIQELKNHCENKKIPLDKLRFHIDEDFKEPKAFGIYKDKQSGKFIVYKNKGNGQRVIRYEGFDEAYAVGEIYQKLKEKALEYKSYYMKRKL